MTKQTLENKIDKFDGFVIEDIETIEDLGVIDSEVYDIEVENCHNFFANDILVHNSLYVEGGRVTRYLDVPELKAAETLVTMWNKGLHPYLIHAFEEYAERYNCVKNYENLELEKISRTTILLSKKHYAMEESWKEPDIFMKSCEDVSYKGIELIQGSTPKFVKECMKSFYLWLLDYYVIHRENPDYSLLVEKFKQYKEEFKLQAPEDICKGAGIGDYNKFVIDDVKSLALGEHCPIHIKGAATANYILNANPEYKAKYQLLRTADKVKYYYAKSQIYEVFSFAPGNFPYDIAPDIDYDMMFEKLILEPLNRVVDTMGYPPVNMNMCWSAALW